MSEHHNIQSTIDRMTSAFAAHDIDRILTTYEPTGVVVAPGGVPVGGDDLPGLFREFIALDPHFDFAEKQIIEVGDIALHLNKWSLTGKAPDGSAVEMGGLSVAVLRKQTDGSWLMVIDHPTGDEVMHG